MSAHNSFSPQDFGRRHTFTLPIWSLFMSSCWLSRHRLYLKTTKHMSLLRRTQELFTSIFSNLKTVKFGKTNIRP